MTIVKFDLILPCWDTMRSPDRHAAMAVVVRVSENVKFPGRFKLIGSPRAQAYTPY